MVKRILLKDELNRALENSIVSFSYKNGEVLNYAFFTRNREIAHYVNQDASLEMLENSDTITVFDILSGQTREIHPGFFTGDVFEVATIGEPSGFTDTVDAKLYLGNLTGAKSISKRFYEAARGVDVEEIGIKEDDSCYVFDSVLEIKVDTDFDSETYNEQQLSNIYLVK